MWALTLVASVVAEHRLSCSVACGILVPMPDFEHVPLALQGEFYLVFSLIFTVASRLLHPYSTDDKTSRLTVKRFSTVRDTQRGSQSYMEKRRGRREIEVARRRKGIKRGEQSSH